MNDVSFFALLVDHGPHGLSLVERNIPDSRADVIVDIINGEYHRVRNVFEFNPVEGWSRDISADIAQAVLEGHEPADEYGDCARAFIESHLRTILREAA
jgi:hypothetical protein